MAEDRHPGINMHKLPVGPGFIGLIFTVGCALIFLLGLPELWSFVALSAVFGVALAVIFRVISRGRAERMKPLSILQSSELKSASRPERAAEGGNWRQRMRRQALSPLSS